eukprot:7651249-Prorocentrum_lima.AAC.1
MWEMRCAAIQGKRPSALWRHPSGYLPTGGPLLEVKQAGMLEHSCLFEAIATALGFAADPKPISQLRGICIEALDQGARDYFKSKWDGLDGFGNPVDDWGEFVQMVQTDMPA